jgi:hypothetical protein
MDIVSLDKSELDSLSVVASKALPDPPSEPIPVLVLDQRLMESPDRPGVLRLF